MQEVTISYLCEAFMAWAGLESLHSTPVNITVPTLHASLDNKVKFMTLSARKSEQMKSFRDKNMPISTV